MTDTQIASMGRGIGLTLVFLIDVLAGVLMGYQFHSFIIGFVTYSVLISLDGLSLKLADIRDSLKGGR